MVQLGEDSNFLPAVYPLWEVPFRKYTFITPSPHFIGLVIPSSKFIAISGKSSKDHLKRIIKGKVENLFKLF